MQCKTIPLSFKSAGASTGEFEGLLSPYGKIDLGNDLVLRGAYTADLKQNGPTRPLLWQHKPDEPIGQVTLEDRTDGLWVKGQLLMELPKAKDVLSLIKANICRGLSIGFEVVKDSVQNGVRTLEALRLWEASLVTFAMAPDARVTSVKSIDLERARLKIAAAQYSHLSRGLDDCIRELKQLNNMWDHPERYRRR